MIGGPRNYRGWNRTEKEWGGGGGAEWRLDSRAPRPEEPGPLHPFFGNVYQLNPPFSFAKPAELTGFRV